MIEPGPGSTVVRFQVHPDRRQLVEVEVEWTTDLNGLWSAVPEQNITTLPDGVSEIELPTDAPVRLVRLRVSVQPVN
jgi:hypothetical protein